MSSSARTYVGPVVLVLLLGALEITHPGKGVILMIAALLLVPLVLAPRLLAALLAPFLAIQELAARNLEHVDKQVATVVKSVDEITMLAGCMYVLVRLARGERFWFRWRDWVWPGVFLACGVLSTALHGAGSLAPAALGFELSAKFFCFILFASAIPWKEGDADRAITGVLWATPVLCITGAIVSQNHMWVTRYLIDPDTLDEIMRGGIMPFIAPFTHPAIFGWAMAVGILAGVVRLQQRRGRALAAIAILFGVVGAIMTLRRRLLLGIPVAIFATVLQVSRKNRIRIIVASSIVVGVAIWFLSANFSTMMDSTIENDMGEKSARLILSLMSLDLGKKYFPFGCGLGRFGSLPSGLWYSDVYYEAGVSSIPGLSPDYPVYVADTYWPHLLGETGYLGLLAMGFFFWTLWSKMRAHQSTAHRLSCLLLVEALMESVAGNVFDHQLRSFVIAMPIGMALRLARQPAAKSAAPPAEAPNAAPVATPAEVPPASAPSAS